MAFRAACAAAGLLALPGLAVAQVSSATGSNFTASSMSESGFYPPDTMGAVGPNHVALLINGRYELYNKNSTGSPISGKAMNLNTFWTTEVGVAGRNGNSFDPRIAYDPFAQRWYAVSVDGARTNNSGYLFAVSKSANPMDGWNGFRWQAEPVSGGNWADFPMMGFDGEYVYISSNHFANTGGTSEYPVYALPKADLLSASPTIDNRQKIALDASTNQTTVALDNLSPAVQAYHLWEDGSSSLPYDKLTKSGSTLARTTGTTSLSGSLNAPSNARQPDSTLTLLEVDDERFSSRLVRIGGSYWGVYPRKLGSDDVLRWFEINASTGTMEQAGTISIAGQDTFYPAISVNADGTVVIGFSASGPSAGDYPSAYAVVGETVGGTTTFGTPFVLKKGTTSYQRLDTSNRNRWGDYSATDWDPADPNIFWTWQEWASGSTNSTAFFFFF